MKRRYLILAISFAALVGIMLGVLAMLPARPGITKENFGRIEKGMTLADVEGIFGANGKLWAKRPVLDMNAFPRGERGKQFWEADDGAGRSCVFSDERCDCAEWRAEDGSMASITIYDNRVINLNWHGSTETTMDKLRRWLHLD